VKGFCLPPSISRAERREVTKIVVDALAGLSGDLAGKYYPLNGMTKEEEAQLIAVSKPLRLYQAYSYPYPSPRTHFRPVVMANDNDKETTDDKS